MKKVNLEFIKNKRLEKKITLQKMADMLGFKKATTYSNYENGERIMKANMLPILSEILDCKIEDFFTN